MSLPFSIKAHVKAIRTARRLLRSNQRLWKNNGTFETMQLLQLIESLPLLLIDCSRNKAITAATKILSAIDSLSQPATSTILSSRSPDYLYSRICANSWPESKVTNAGRRSVCRVRRRLKSKRESLIEEDFIPHHLTLSRSIHAFRRTPCLLLRRCRPLLHRRNTCNETTATAAAWAA